MLSKPPIDKIAAKVLIERAQLDEPLKTICFWDERELEQEQIERWRQEGFFPIDLGGEKYHQTQFGSAAEFVADKLGFPLTPGEKKIIKILGRNNRTGYLKGFHLSIAWLIRELYEFEADYDHRQLVELVSGVVRMWLQTEDVDAGEVERTEDALIRQFPEFAEMYRRCNNSPFTAGRYLRDLWQCGYAPQVIREFVGFWVKAWDFVQAKIQKAECELANVARDNEFTAGGFRGLWLETADKCLVRVAARRVGILVVKHPQRGNVAFMSKGLDFYALAAELCRLEPNLWHMSGGFVVNGGIIYTGVPPTQAAGTKERAIKLVRMFPPRRPKPEEK